MQQTPLENSTAKSEENFCVKMDWLVGLPLITGRFGCPTQVESDSFFAVRSRGSMDEELLNQYIETVIVSQYEQDSNIRCQNRKTQPRSSYLKTRRGAWKDSIVRNCFGEARSTF